MKIIHKIGQLVVVFYLLTIITACSIQPTPPTKEQPIITACSIQPTPPTKEQHLTPEEADDLLKKNNENILFVDVRTPAEVASKEMLALADANVPYLLKKWNEDQKKFEWKINNDFVSTIGSRLKEKDLDKQDTVILICSEGSRSAKAVNVLAKEGYKNVYSVIGGNIKWKEMEEWEE
ncbi:MAG: hypothetical protein DRR19_31490 [Candidatus Parabeggiatoa sp. nov. 1]|nr:MAG: hypothetical protein DRR19_31490 [Gammaproteobacteria bacterium]